MGTVEFPSKKFHLLKHPSAVMEVGREVFYLLVCFCSSFYAVAYVQCSSVKVTPSISSVLVCIVQNQGRCQVI